VAGMSEQKLKLWTAEELEKLSPNQRAKLLNDRVVTDLSTLDPALVERIRAYGRKLAIEHGLIEPSEM
jgi:hypothetical protein